MSTSDWSGLPSNLITCIGGLLVADDFADFNRFRAVCHPWRSSTEEMKRRIGCRHRPYWIMLSNPKLSLTEPIEFYNTSTHKSFWFDLKDYLEEYSLFRALSCLIMLQNNNTQGLALLNPFMRSLTQLPSKIQSNCPEAPSKLEDIIRNMDPLTDVYVTSSSTMVLRFLTLEFLVWTQPDDLNWVYVKFNVLYWSNVLFYEDRLLFFDPYKGVVQINFANGMSSQPQVEVVIPVNARSLDENAWHLIECNNKIFMVSFDPENSEEQHFWESLVIYKLVLNSEECADVTEIGNYSIFLGDNRTISVSSKNGVVPANCIYFCDVPYQCGTAWLNLSTNRLKFSSKKPFLRPNSLVKKLIKYCR